DDVEVRAAHAYNLEPATGHASPGEHRVEEATQGLFGSDVDGGTTGVDGRAVLLGRRGYRVKDALPRRAQAQAFAGLCALLLPHPDHCLVGGTSHRGYEEAGDLRGLQAGEARRGAGPKLPRARAPGQRMAQIRIEQAD